MTAPRKIQIRPVPSMDCWCAAHVNDDGYETDIIVTGFGLEELVIILGLYKDRSERVEIIIPGLTKEAAR